jgi:hypothetical protein
MDVVRPLLTDTGVQYNQEEVRVAIDRSSYRAPY